MSRTLGQTVVVENVGGAGIRSAWRASQSQPRWLHDRRLASARPRHPPLYDGLKYDVVNDFDHLGRITDVPMTLVSKTPFSCEQRDRALAWIKSEATKASYVMPASARPHTSVRWCF